LKAKLFVTLAIAAVLCVAVLACSSLKGDKEETTSTPTPATTPATPATPAGEGNVTKTTAGDEITYKGALRGVNDSNKFDIFAQSEHIEVEFDWPSDASFHVKVLGMAGDELGDFDLSQGEIIELTGGGKFTLIVYSRSGDGAWSATYTD
jgi:hypothetical protein